MSDAPTFNQGIRYPEGMTPFKAGSLLFKLANYKADAAGSGKKKKGPNAISKKMTQKIVGKSAAVSRGGKK